ncbi:unnamed protein product [Heligmosomoides polygyrus]|uniref:CCHC-type domain-containing protein n=1 Tax=Heligmosomoides polygyrus TaxID=6339 RepID=A0A3P8F337_HELPZ|nr:unnamed protein product [Heligmosomoides polygyrus]
MARSVDDCTEAVLLDDVCEQQDIPVDTQMKDSSKMVEHVGGQRTSVPAASTSERNGPDLSALDDWDPHFLMSQRKLRQLKGKGIFVGHRKDDLRAAFRYISLAEVFRTMDHNADTTMDHSVMDNNAESTMDRTTVASDTPASTVEVEVNADPDEKKHANMTSKPQRRQRAAQGSEYCRRSHPPVVLSPHAPSTFSFQRLHQLSHPPLAHRNCQQWLPSYLLGATHSSRQPSQGDPRGKCRSSQRGAGLFKQQRRAEATVQGSSKTNSQIHGCHRGRSGQARGRVVQVQQHFGRVGENTPSISELSMRIANHSEAAQLLIDRAHEALSTLMKLQADIDCSTDRMEADMLETKLAPIPIPKFKGDIWEWDTFWTSFSHNVHSRNIDDLYKLNYLLEALQGDALESAKQFEVSGSTYSLVVAHLKQKYGNKQALVECLLRKLQSAKSRSTRLVDQETLCEQLFSIVSQLKLKNEHVDNTFLQKQLLAKFSVDVQRHILREKARCDEEEWNTMKLLSSAQEFLKEELQIIKQTESRQDNRERQEQFAPTTTGSSNKGQRVPPCFYCRKMGHLPKHCSEVSTHDQRLHIMKTRKLCHNCGANDHMATKCRRGACRACGIAGHHTSICRKLFETQETPHLPQTTKPVKKPPAKPASPSSRSSAKVNSVALEQAVDDQPTSDTVLHVNDNADGSNQIVGKSKLPPTKGSPTIPKSELNALTMAVRLAYTVYEAIKERTSIEDVTIFSDSEIALSWIATYPLQNSVEVLVRNRVREIRRLVADFQPPVWFG